jgi:hypothetical protein
MTPLDFFSFAGGTLALLLTLHLSVFWLSRFLYPPQKPMIVVTAPPPPAPVVVTPSTLPLPSQPPLPDYTKTSADLPSYVENASKAQVPVVNNEPLPPPISVAK